MEIKLETITKEKALKYLEKNVHNRPLRQGQVDFFVNLIKNEDFKLTHQGIAFDENGKLADGQHRLWAIAEANIPVQMYVTRGLPEEAFHGIDMGAKRTMGDAVFTNVKYGKTYAEISSFILRLLGFPRPTPTNIEKIFGMKGDLMVELMAACSVAKRTLTAAPLRTAVVYWADNALDKQAVFDLYKAIVNLDFENLPPVGQAFLKQVMAGNKHRISSNASLDLFNRAMTVFDPNKSQLSKIQISEPDTNLKKIATWMKGWNK